MRNIARKMFVSCAKVCKIKFCVNSANFAHSAKTLPYRGGLRSLRRSSTVLFSITVKRLNGLHSTDSMQSPTTFPTRSWKLGDMLSNKIKSWELLEYDNLKKTVFFYNVGQKLLFWSFEPKFKLNFFLMYKTIIQS